MNRCFVAPKWLGASLGASLLLGVQPAMADASKCAAGVIAKFHVVMEGPRASVPVSFNGHEARVWLDSGAFYNFMPKAKAVELGLPLEPLPFGFIVNGIGGSYVPQLARVRDFGIVGVTLHNTEFVVGGTDSGNGYLGANFLGVWTTEFDLAHGAVNLLKEHNCSNVSMAYWGAGMSVSDAKLLGGDNPNDHHIYVEVFVNGHSLRAMLDSGAPNSIIGRHAAMRAGIDLDDPKVLASVKMGGVGVHERKSWIAHSDVISIGGEDIRNSPIRVIDDAGDVHSFDMLLGVDFLMSHHVIVSQPQRRMYLTYNGGPIFSASTEGELGHLATRAENMGASEKVAEPTTVDALAGRASARLEQGDVPGAIVDFTSAIALAPGRADLLAERAGAYMRAHQTELAGKDIDAGLAITPKDHLLLTHRAQLKLGRGDRAGALADTDAAAQVTPKGSLDAMALVALYERLGLADRGLALIDQVIELHHEDARYPHLLNARSYNRALANVDLDRALKDINTAIRKSEPSPAMLDTRALVELRRKDYPAAITDETAALDKAPKTADALFVRGLARLAADAAGGAGDIAAARAISPKIDQRYAAYGLVAPKTN